MKTKRWIALLLMLVLVLTCAGTLAEAGQNHNVTFVANNGLPDDVTVTGEPAVQSVQDGNTVVQPSAPAAAGYRFAGWYSDAGLTAQYDFTAKVTGDITLYASWTAIECKVTFDLQDSSLTPIAPITVNYGDTVDEPDAPTREGYAFGGWYKEPTCANQFDFTAGVTSDITLYARWDVKRYAVTFDNNGHGVKPADQQVNHGSTAANPGSLAEQGWQFDGWYADAGFTGDAYDFSTPVTKAVSLTAKWTQLHKVSFDMNGHGAVIKPVSVADGGSIAAPAAPAADGYAFTGWYSDSALSAAYAFGSAVSGDMTLYAGWTATVKVQFQWKTAITHAGDVPSDSAKIALVVNGSETDQTMTVAPGKTESWTGLSAADRYSVAARDVPANYTAVITRLSENSYMVTYVEDDKLDVTPIINTHVPDMIDMVISKRWDDNNNQHRPEEIKVQVKKNVNGVLENVGDPITLNADNQWTAHVTDLYMRQSGQTIQYTIEEVSEVMGYTTSCEIAVDAQGNYTVKVTNVLTGKVDIVGTKVWDDDDDRDGIRPDSVQLKLYENAIADANLVKNVIVTKREDDDDGNVWHWTVEDLPVYDKFGRPITYIVVEDPVPEGYTASAPQYVTVGTPGGDPTP